MVLLLPRCREVDCSHWLPPPLVVLLPRPLVAHLPEQLVLLLPRLPNIEPAVVVLLLLLPSQLSSANPHHFQHAPTMLEGDSFY
jgi:hypothetical protein